MKVWPGFQSALNTESDMNSNLIMGIAHHGGEPALRMLSDLTSPGHAIDMLKDAVFWLAHRSGPSARPIIEELISTDSDTEMREHAVFSLAQMDNATEALLAILTNNSLDMPVRKQALFWLAQTGSPEAFEAIDQLLAR